jgi:hypothetical protein
MLGLSGPKRPKMVTFDIIGTAARPPLSRPCLSGERISVTDCSRLLQMVMCGQACQAPQVMDQDG